MPKNLSGGRSIIHARQPYSKHGLYIWSASNGDSAIMGMYDRLCDGQTQSCTGRKLCGSIDGHIFTPIEAVKDMGKVFGVDAFTVVNYLNNCLIVLLVQV